MLLRFRALPPLCFKYKCACVIKFTYLFISSEIKSLQSLRYHLDTLRPECDWNGARIIVIVPTNKKMICLENHINNMMKILPVLLLAGCLP